MIAIKIIKWFFGFLVGFAVLILLAIIIVPRVFEPNDYREQIADLVQQKTGRELQLNGDLSLSVFPWLGIRTQGLSLSQPAEIGGAMVQVETAQLRLKIMPLLSKRVEIDTVILEQPQLKFITLENGINSLTGLTDSDEVEQDDAEQANPEVALGLVIQGVELTDGSLEWDDRQAKQRYQINDLQLVTGNLIGDSMADLQLSGTVLDLSDSSIEAQPLAFSLEGQALINTDTLLVAAQNLVTQVDYGEYQLGANIADMEFDANNSKLAVNALSLDVEAAIDAQALKANTSIANFNYDLESSQIAVNAIGVNADVDGQPINLTIPSVTANLDQQTASITQTKLSSDDLRVEINDLSVTNFIDDLAAKGSLEVPKFNAAALVERFDVDYQTADSSALNSVGLSTSFVAGLDQVELSGINVALDETSLSGNFSARNFDQLALNFDLALDSIDLDRYLPPEDEADDASDDAVSGADALAVPMAMFKDFNANGSFKADKFVSAGVELTNIDVDVKSTPGSVAITPKAQLYDGEIDGSMVYTEKDGVSQLHVKNRVGIVDLAKFLTDTDVTDQLTGFGSVDLDVVVTERDGVQSNSGTIKLSAKDGTVQGVDIKNMIEKAYSTYQAFSGKQDSDAAQGASQEDDSTGFADLFGTFNLKDFNISNNDFQMNAPFFRITGNGNIDLSAENLDYTLNVAIVESTAGQGGESVDKLKGLTLPIRLHGSFAAPSYSLDTKALFSSLAKAKIEEEKSKFVQEKLGIETDGDVSTKSILSGLLKKELGGDDDEPSADTDVIENKEAAANSPDQPAELTEEEQKDKAEDDLKDELKNKLLNSIFN